MPQLGVITPDDPYPVWEEADSVVTIAPEFLLYDYTFLPEGALIKEEGLAQACQTGVVCSRGAAAPRSLPELGTLVPVGYQKSACPVSCSDGQGQP